jgi:hypothetical protein
MIGVFTCLALLRQRLGAKLIGNEGIDRRRRKILAPTVSAKENERKEENYDERGGSRPGDEAYMGSFWSRDNPGVDVNATRLLIE